MAMVQPVSRAVYFSSPEANAMRNEDSSLLAAPVIVAARFDPVLALTAHISAAYFGTNKIDTEKVARLITEIHRTLAGLARNGQGTPEPAALASPVSQLPGSLDPRKTVFPDHMLCLECGAKRKALKRHLSDSHQMTPEEYRAKWNLPVTYPMVAPNYSKARSKMAKAMGLGKSGRRAAGKR
jgi:predicted transcriptional regulator